MSDCASPVRPGVKRSTHTVVLMAEATDVDADNRLVARFGEQQSALVECELEGVERASPRARAVR